MGRHSFPPHKRGHQSHTSPGVQPLVLFPLFSGPEEDLRSSTHHQPERSQPVPVGRFLLHWNFDLSTSRYSPRLVYGVFRSQICLPPCAYSQVTLAVTTLCTAGSCGCAQGVPMESASIWAGHHAPGIHQGDAPVGHSVAQARTCDVAILGRHFFTLTKDAWAWKMSSSIK